MITGNTRELIPLPEYKTYADLKRWDCIYAHYGRSGKLRECVVLNVKQKDDLVEIRLHPPTENYLNKNRIIRATFRAFHPVTITRQAPIQTRVERAEQWLLEQLDPGVPMVLVSYLRDRAIALGHKAPAHRTLVHAARNLARIGEVVIREEVKDSRGRSPSIRLPIPEGMVDIPVLFLPDMRSERLGWIESWQEHRPTGTIRPVIRFIDGSTAFAVDHLIEPTKNKVYLSWIRAARTGVMAVPPYEIPDSFFPLIRRRIGQTMPHQVAMGLAKMIRLEHAAPTVLRNQIAQYLDTYYPGWIYGVNLRAIAPICPNQKLAS